MLHEIIGMAKESGRGGVPCSNFIFQLVHFYYSLMIRPPDPKSSEQIIAAKVSTVREERAKVLDNLTAAQKGIRQLLTPRQEAILAAAGYLD